MEWRDEYLPYLSGIFLILVVPWGRRVWLDINFASVFLKGLVAVVLPGMITSMHSIEGTLDVVHIRLIHGMGIWMIYTGFCYWLMRKSNDVTVETSQLWSLTISMACIGMAAAYHLFTYTNKGTRVTEQVLKSTMVFLPLWVLVSLVYGLKDSDWGGYAESHGRRNLHLRIDSICTLLVGVALYAFPEWFLKPIIAEPDGLHLYLTRAIAGMGIGFSTLGNRASNFLREDDKQSYLLSRLLTEGTGRIIFCFYLLNRDKLLGKFSNLQIIGSLLVGIFVMANAASGCDMRSVLKNTAECIKRIPETVKNIPTDIKNLVKTKRQ